MESMKSDVRALDSEALLAHTAWMRGLARQLVLGADRVDDLVQEAWAAAVARPPAAGIPLRAWLGRVLHNQARLARRAEGRRGRREREAARAEGLPSVAELTECADQQRLLLEIVTALPEPYREVLLLRFFEDQKPAAIARHLGLPVDTVRTRQQRALERVRAELDRRHAGDRSAWALALLPLASPAPAAAGVLSGLLLPSLGAWIMTSPLKATALAAFTLVAGLGLWSLRSKPTPDLRRFGSPEEAASTLFTKARSSSASAAPARVASTPASRTVRGTVVDPDGRPIPGVALWRAAAPRPRAFMPFQRRERTFADGGWLRTDAAGRFAGELTADEPPPWLGARHADFLALQHLHPSSTEHDIEIRMTPLGRTQLEVEVIERPSGRRVPRYRLMASVQRPTGAEGGVASWSVLSRDELAFGAPLEVEFAVGLPLHLMVEVLGLGVGLDPDNVRREVTPVPGGTTHVRFELDLGAAERVAGVRTAFGRVLDDVTGEPLGGVEISAHPWRGVGTVDGVTRSDYGAQDRRVQTFEDGRFVVALEEGGPAALLQAFHPHFQPALVRFDGQSEAELRLQRRGALRGVVVGEQGQPLPDVPLLFLGEEDELELVTFELPSPNDRRRTFTDDEGRFEFTNLDARRYHVFVLAGPRDPDERALASESYMLAAGEERDVVLEVNSPERVRVHGRVVPPAGVDHALVPIFLPYDGELGWTLGQPTANGYTAGGLARGRYLVLLAPANDDHGGPWSLVPGVEIDAFGEQALDFAWPLGSLAGEVRVEGSAEGLFVTVRPELPAGFARDFLGAGEAGELFRVPVDATGAFRVEHLAPGEHVLELGRSQHGTHRTLAQRRVTITGRTVLTPWQP